MCGAGREGGRWRSELGALAGVISVGGLFLWGARARGWTLYRLERKIGVNGRSPELPGRSIFASLEETQTITFPPEEPPLDVEPRA